MITLASSAASGLFFIFAIGVLIQDHPLVLSLVLFIASIGAATFAIQDHLKKEKFRVLVSLLIGKQDKKRKPLEQGR